MNILAVLLAWFGCLAAYLASDNQRLLTAAIPRVVGWSVFAYAMGIAMVLLKIAYNPVAAALMSLMFVMCLWPAVILSAAHLRNRMWLLNGVAVVILVLIMGAG